MGANADVAPMMVVSRSATMESFMLLTVMKMYLS
jgi:hypothetical protein